VSSWVPRILERSFDLCGWVWKKEPGDESEGDPMEAYKFPSIRTHPLPHIPASLINIGGYSSKQTIFSS